MERGSSEEISLASLPVFDRKMKQHTLGGPEVFGVDETTVLLLKASPPGGSACSKWVYLT